MTLDTPTLFTSVTIACFSGAGMLSLFAVVIRNQTRTVRKSSLVWAAGMLLLGFSCILFGLRGQISDTFSIVLANSLLLIGNNLRPAALRIFFGAKNTYIWPGFAVALCWVLLFFFTPFQDSYIARTLTTLGLLIINSAHVVWLCLSKNRDDLTTTRLMVGVALLEMAAYVMNLTVQTLDPQTSLTAIFSTPATSLYLVLMIICTVSSSALIVAMTLEKSQLTYQEQATRDQLTGLRNRRAFFEDAETWRTARQNQNMPYALLIIDVDNLASVNSQFGQALSEAMLKLLTRICQDTVEKPCFVGRIGAEEFALFLPGQDDEAAAAIATRVSRLMTTQSSAASAGRFKMSLSNGIFHGTPSTSLERAFEIATRCIAQAKADGIGKTVASSGETSEGSLQTTAVLCPFSRTQRSIA